MADMEKTSAYEESRVETAAQGGHAMPTSLASLTPEEYAKVGKKATFKIDILIMPAMIVMYILNYLDRQNIAAAKLANLEQDLNLTDVQYQTCISLLFVGYILMQVPSTIIVGKINRPAVYICLAMALWGVISAATGAVHNFSGLVVCRFFLGFVEAVFFPGALHYLSTFYNRKQYTTRVALLYSGSQLGNAFGGLFAIAILKADGVHGLEGWRWLFIIEGAATVGLALIFMLFLPNNPATTKGLTDAERDWISWNFELDQGQKDHKEELTGMQAFVLAVTDPKTWLLMATLYMTYIAAAVVSFFPSVVSTLGYSRNITYVLTAPPYLLCVVVMIVNGFHSDKTQERYLHIVIPLVFTIVANIIALSTLNTAARYVAMMLMPGSFYGATAVILSWIAGSITQPAVKRAAAISLINAVCNTPNIWTTYLYKASPRYLAAFSVNLASGVAAILCATLTRWYLRKQNAILDRGLDEKRSAPTKEQQASGFRYLI